MTYLLLLAALLGYHARRWQRAQPRQETATPLVTPLAAPLPLGCPDNEAPKVSFLVPAWNAAEDIAGFVEAYRALSYPRKELLLCVGGKDDSLKLAQSYAGGSIRVLEQFPGEGKQRALAKSFAESTGSIIYLTDIDCRPDTRSFRRLLEPIVSGRESVVTGASVPLEEQYTVGAVVVHWAVERKAAGSKPRPIDGLLGRNCAVTREAVEAVHSFRYEAPTGTDYRMAQLLQAQGHRIWFEPESAVKTAFAWPPAVYMRKQARWLRNVILYAERPRQAAEFRGALVVLAAPYGFLLLLALSLVSGSFLPGFVALLLLLHGTLNRLHYVHETLAARHLRSAVVPGSVLDLFATLTAGLYASLTLLTPSLRKQW